MMSDAVVHCLSHRSHDLCEEKVLLCRNGVDDPSRDRSICCLDYCIDCLLQDLEVGIFECLIMSPTSVFDHNL